MEMGLKNKYQQKLMLLSGDMKKGTSHILDMSTSIGAFGVSLLEETILVRVLGDERGLDADYLTELFDSKCRSAHGDAKRFGYGILHRKKFHEVPTLKDAYMYFIEHKLLDSRAWVGITENVSGRFLFFNQGKKVNTWVQHCVDGYKKSLKDVIDILDYTQNNKVSQPTVISVCE